MFDFGTAALMAGALLGLVILGVHVAVALGVTSVIGIFLVTGRMRIATPDGAPGAVVLSATSVSADLRHAIRVPLTDPLTPPSATGGYPWRVTATGGTVVYLKNATNDPQGYVLQPSGALRGPAPTPRRPRCASSPRSPPRAATCQAC